MKEKLGVRARWDMPGSIQRMSSAHFSEVDLKEARACGARAVRFALRGAIRLHGRHAPEPKRKTTAWNSAAPRSRKSRTRRRNSRQNTSTAAPCSPPPPSAATPCRSSAPDCPTTRGCAARRCDCLQTAEYAPPKTRWCSIAPHLHALCHSRESRSMSSPNFRSCCRKSLCFNEGAPKVFTTLTSI